MKKAPEKYRVTNGLNGSNASWGNNGAFLVPHYKIADYSFYVIISNGMGWDHVSVTIVSGKKQVKRCCTWEEMCFIKDLFFDDEECAVQYHPPKSEYVSTHPYCLHLWAPIGREIPRPNPIMVGVPGDNIQA